MQMWNVNNNANNNYNELKQVRSTTTLKKQLKILVFKGNHGLLTTCCIFNEHFMTSKKAESFKNNCFGYFEFNLKWQFSSLRKLTSSWRRENPPSVVVYRKRTPWDYSWDWKLFILFVLHEWLYCLRDVVVEANVVFA